MKEFKAKFVKSIQLTEHVVSFSFKPEEPLEFTPGQFVQVIFDEPNRANKNINKYLSFSCAPLQDVFTLTKKISESDFSGQLKNLKSGADVLFKGPMGQCVLEGSDKAICFLTGGIGITPVISILESIVKDNRNVDVVLLYSNWTIDDIAFKDQLDTWSQNNTNLKIIYLLMEMPEGQVGCFQGLITRDFVKAHLPDMDARSIFIFGPPGMVTSMKNICSELGCDPKRLKAENFIGY